MGSGVLLIMNTSVVPVSWAVVSRARDTLPGIEKWVPVTKSATLFLTYYR